MRYKNILIILGIISIIAFTFFYKFIYLKTGTYSPHSPDESNVLFFAKQIIENNEFIWKSQLNERYNVPFFIPRASVEVGKNLYAPMIAPYFVLIIALSSLFEFNHFINSIFGVIGILFFYLLVQYVFKSKKLGLIGAILLAFFPTYALFANTYYDIIPSSVFWIGSLYYFVRFLSEDDYRFSVFCVIFFMISIAIRPPHAFLVMAYLIPLIIYYKKIFTFRNISATLLAGIVCIILFFGINYSVYGSFFSTGRTMTGQNIGKSGVIKTLMRINFNPDAISTAFNNYLLHYETLIFIGGVLGIIRVKQIKSKVTKTLIYSLIPLCIFLLFYFGSNPNFYGFSQTRVDGSLSRYFLPIYVCLIIATVYFLNTLKNRKIKILYVVILIINIFIFTFGGLGSLTNWVLSNEKFCQYNRIVKTTPKKSIFIVKQYDKCIVLDRPVMLMYNSEDLKKRPDLEYLFPLLDIDKDLIPIIQRLHKDGYTIYISTESPSAEKKLREQNFKLIKIKNTPFMYVKDKKCRK